MVTKSRSKTTPLFSSKANGIVIGAGLEVEFELVVSANIAVEIVDKFGKVVTGSCKCACGCYCTALRVCGCLHAFKRKWPPSAGVVGDVLHTLLGLVLAVVKCLLF